MKSIQCFLISLFDASTDCTMGKLYKTLILTCFALVIMFLFYSQYEASILPRDGMRRYLEEKVRQLTKQLNQKIFSVAVLTGLTSGSSLTELTEEEQFAEIKPEECKESSEFDGGVLTHLFWGVI